jgi:hypothetical protein
LSDDGTGIFVAEAPGMVSSLGLAEAHAAEADRRQLKARRPELGVLHRIPPENNRPSVVSLALVSP